MIKIVLLITTLLLIGCKDANTQSNRKNKNPRNQVGNTKGTVISKNGLNIRKYPKVTSSLIFTIPKNGTVKILKRKDDVVIINKKIGRWNFIKWGNYEGWIFDAYLSTRLIMLKPFFNEMYLGMTEKEVEYLAKKIGLLTELNTYHMLRKKLFGMKVWIRPVYNKDKSVNQINVNFLNKEIEEYKPKKIQQELSKLKKEGMTIYYNVKRKIIQLLKRKPNKSDVGYKASVSKSQTTPYNQNGFESLWIFNDYQCRLIYMVHKAEFYVVNVLLVFTSKG